MFNEIVKAADICQVYKEWERKKSVKQEFAPIVRLC